MAVLLPTETLERHINQSGVRPGPKKLAQFKEALRLRATPPLYAQEDKGDEAIAHVKLFNPCGAWTWYLTEWDGEDEAFGLVYGDVCEFGYISLADLASVRGALGIGIEIDVFFKPKPLREIRQENAKPEPSSGEPGP